MAFFLRFDDSYVELVSNLGNDQGPTPPSGSEERGEGVHLIAMKVDDLDATLAELREKGVRLVGAIPGLGNPARGQVFVHLVLYDRGRADPARARRWNVQRRAHPETMQPFHNACGPNNLSAGRPRGRKDCHTPWKSTSCDQRS